MEVSKLKLHKAFITPEQTVIDFLKLGLLAIPVVKDEKPIAYATLTHIIGYLMPMDVLVHANAIAKLPGGIELTKKTFLERFKSGETIGNHTIPLLATVEFDDPIVKAVSFMLDHRIPIIAVTKGGKYIGYINFECVGSYLSQFNEEE
ncbi:MAG: hypothetical protein HQK84_06730 [Nitrospinae bacterium]|nr:hypothetical protein [Nitrospinota bacterium]